MFGNLLGKKRSESSEIAQRIHKMNLADMRSYVNNKSKDFEISETGIIEVLKRLVLEDPKTSKRYIQSDDMDSKIKKAFDLVIAISTSKKMTINAIELMQKFIEVYSEIIIKYDKENKDIYSSRFKDAMEKSLYFVGEVTKLKEKMGVLK